VREWEELTWVTPFWIIKSLWMIFAIALPLITYVPVEFDMNEKDWPDTEV